MKSRKFLFVTLLLLLFINGGLKAQTEVRTVTNNLVFPIRCNGVIIDLLNGTAVNHMLRHLDKDGKIDWYKNNWEATDMVSRLTGEAFMVSFQQKQDGIGLYEDIVIVTIHYNCVGDMGSHYIVSETIQLDFTNIKPPAQPRQTILKQDCKCW